MKKILFITLLNLVTIVAFGTSKESKREITKSFSVGANPTLEIDNKYGDIRIIEGKEKEILFRIEIVGKGTDDKTAQKIAESVSISFEQKGNTVSAETVFGSTSSCNNCGRKVDYVVVVPKNTTLDLENKYGNVFLDNIVKPLELDLEYGNLEANSLTKAVIDIKYGKATINSCDELALDSKYSHFELKTVGKAIVESKYDGFKIGSIEDLILDTKYTDVKIEKLNKSIIAEDFKYCGLDIKEIATAFSTIRIEAGYSHINLGLNKNHSFKAHLKGSYSELKLGNVEFQNTSVKNDNEVKGVAGKESSPKASVNIQVAYGSIKF